MALRKASHRFSCTRISTAGAAMSATPFTTITTSFSALDTTYFPSAWVTVPPFLSVMEKLPVVA